MGTRYFRNWFHEPNGNDDFRLPTKAQEGAWSAIEEVRGKGKEKRDGWREMGKGGKEWRWDVGLYEEKAPAIPFLKGKEEEVYETSVLINNRNNLYTHSYENNVTAKK